MATSIKIDGELKSRVQHLAGVRHRSAHWIMLEAISQYVEREEKRESFKNDALRAWQAFEANGKHLTGDEADAWLGSLENGEDKDIPECHD
ncbi:CopG family ribbon-helix-helix protein [Pinirhizobacter sp.]|jgi:predicted transcriptional regulator|uniref:CopG family ribbon-helix-helix protein n=1 Tax=Pinirhizobacter sp. TaxID=2950432 RepID=UPI002F40270F